MTSHNPLIFHLVIGLVTVGVLASCSDSNTDAGWDLDEPDPRAEVDASLCAEMPNGDLSTPEVMRDGEETWRIRYPLYEEGCGAYQLDTIMNFGAVPPEDPFYHHEVSVCNRCDSTQTWNYLYLLNAAEAGDEDLEIEVPQEPRIADVSGLLPTGMPVVEHRTTSEDHSFRICAQLGTSMYDGGAVGERQPKFVSYDDIYSMPIESGEKNVQAAYDLKPRNFQSLASDLLAGQLDEDGANITAIYTCSVKRNLSKNIVISKSQIPQHILRTRPDQIRVDGFVEYKVE